MKFLCPNCKAKYQIADEKVGGRTLKMDCRRCQHTIVLRGDQPQADEQAAPAAPTGNPATASRPGAARPAPTAPGARSATNVPVAAPARRPAGATTGRGGSHVGPMPARPAAQRSALSADFRRTGAAAPPPEPPQRTTPLDQWHVAINDVPVGPMRRDEITRKISTGAVTADSLAWREGFDDWRPLRDIPELAALMRRSTQHDAVGRASDRPPAGRPGAARMPAAPVRGPATASRPGAARPMPGPGARTADPRTAAAAARSNVVAIGGRLGASAAPAMDDELDELEGEPTRVASAVDLPSFERNAEQAEARSSAVPAAAPARSKSHPPPAMHESLPDPFPSSPQQFGGSPGSSSQHAMPAVALHQEPRGRERRGLPVGAWIGIAGAMAFGIAMAVMIAPRLIGGTPDAAAAIATTAPVAAAPTAPIEAPVTAETPEVAAVDPTPIEPTAVDVPAEAAVVPHAGGEHHTTKRAGTVATTAGGGGAATKTTGSSVFDRFQDDGEGAAVIAPHATAPQEHGGAAGTGELTADQIRSVVSREQRALQACWELAIRGMREVPTTRLDVDITIGASGTVTSANARGVGVGNLSECIERNVRRWHFPPSGDSARTSFPVVFQSAS